VGTKDSRTTAFQTSSSEHATGAHNALFNRCQTTHSRAAEKQVPWLCPDRHWSVMNRGLDPPYASAIQTGYSTINRLAGLLSSDHSLGILALLNPFGRAIQQTRPSILSSDQNFHALAAQVLHDFLGTARLRTLQEQARTVDHPWRASLSPPRHNPFQRLVLPGANTGIKLGWTLDPAPQARASPPPNYFIDSKSVQTPASKPMGASNMSRSAWGSVDITSQSILDRTSPSVSSPLTLDLPKPTSMLVRHISTLPIPAPGYDSLQPWHSTELTRIRAPRATRASVVEEGESNEGESRAIHPQRC
jgi:hypothetical protein